MVGSSISSVSKYVITKSMIGRRNWMSRKGQLLMVDNTFFKSMAKIWFGIKAIPDKYLVSVSVALEEAEIGVS